MIGLLRFRLAEGADEVAFLAADKRVQQEFAYHQPGLLRRTTARGVDGWWIVLDLWRSDSDADACDARWGVDPVTKAFMGYVDSGSVTNERWHELGG